MYAELKELLYDAEDHYLQGEELGKLREHVDSLQQRLKIYKTVRNNEILLFQAIADQLESELPSETARNLEKAIVQWATVLRYVSMGMLLDSYEFVQRRILEWLNPMIQAQANMDLNQQLCQILCNRLRAILEQEEWELLQPFLQEAKDSLLESNVLVS